MDLCPNHAPPLNDDEILHTCKIQIPTLDQRGHTLMSLWTLLAVFTSFFPYFPTSTFSACSAVHFLARILLIVSFNLSGLAIEVPVTDVYFCYSFDTTTLGVPVLNSLRHYNLYQTQHNHRSKALPRLFIPLFPFLLPHILLHLIN